MCLAIPGEIIELREEHGLRFGRVRFGGVTRDVCLEYQPAATVGDFVLVHVGFAIATLDREEAERTWELLRELGEPTEPTDPARPGERAVSLDRAIDDEPPGPEAA